MPGLVSALPTPTQPGGKTNNLRPAVVIDLYPTMDRDTLIATRVRECIRELWQCH